jgi:branched-chain amino acid transport system ATP-binding protein
METKGEIIMSLLQIERLTRNFGGLTAVSNVSLEVEEHELVGLIGPNGAGKTTLFNVLTGVYTPSSGRVMFQKGDKSIELSKLPPYKITRMGVARTFQNIRLFKELSVLDNVKIAMNHEAKYGLFGALFRIGNYFKSEALIEEKAHAFLKEVNLDELSETKAKNLPYGKQRQLEIARALATGAKLLFLDEPAAGLNDIETDRLIETIRKIQKEYKVTIFLVEHDMGLVMELCDTICAISFGKKLAIGTPKEIQSNPIVQEAYLGGE